MTQEPRRNKIGEYRKQKTKCSRMGPKSGAISIGLRVGMHCRQIVVPQTPVTELRAHISCKTLVEHKDVMLPSRPIITLVTEARRRQSELG